METVVHQEIREDLKAAAADIARALADLTAREQACRCALGFSEEAYKEAYNEAFEEAFPGEFEAALAVLMAEQ